ncbi:hypothetical protein RI129_003456 [Pyrocoelia pectoralis]|uniref:THAP-type domain-containing protein n=1 Tax=Pyrocoelia pectoralis TaxID=417401 RepID=A0AAN7VPE2_9COLE
MEPSKRCYKWCFVPMCTNTTFTTPEKTFVTMPREAKVRKMWFKAARRDDAKISSSDFYCCEDHFDLKEDMENYMYHNLMGVKIRMKPGRLPHFFNCQEDRKRAFSVPSRTLPQKRARKEYIANAISSIAASTSTSGTSTVTSGSIIEEISAEAVPINAFQNKSIQVNINKPHRSKSTFCDIHPKNVQWQFPL